MTELSFLIKEASFCTDGAYYRELQLVKIQRINNCGVPTPNSKGGNRMIVKGQRPRH